MLSLGHIASSYLIAESAIGLGIPLNSDQILGTVITGNIIDFDFLFTGMKGEKHHQVITHTPIGILALWILLIIFIKPEAYFSLVLLIVLVVHLMLDDFGYWIYKLKFHTYKVNPQINWLYPYTKFSIHKKLVNNREILKIYFTKAWPTALLEIVFVLSAVLVFFLK